MLREKEKILFLINRLTDLGLTIGAFIIAYYIRVYLSPEYFKVLRYTSDYKIVILMVVIIWYSIFEKFHIYSLYKESISLKTLWKILQAVSLGMLVLVLCMYLFSITTMSRLIIGLFYILNIGLILVSKFVIQNILKRLRRMEINIRKEISIHCQKRLIQGWDQCKRTGCAGGLSLFHKVQCTPIGQATTVLQVCPDEFSQVTKRQSDICDSELQETADQDFQYRNIAQRNQRLGKVGRIRC